MISARKIHGRFAIVVALPFLWLLSTGIVLWALLFLRESRQPYALRSEQPVAVAGQLQLHSARASLNGHESHITRVTFGHAGQSLRVSLANGDVWYWVPGESEPFYKSGPTPSDRFIRILSDLHRGKFLGAAGRYAFTFFGFSILAYLFTGIALLKQRAGKQNRRKIHRILGWSVMLPLLSLILSGSILNVASEMRSVPNISQSAIPHVVTFDDWESALILARERDAEDRITLIAKVGSSLLTEFASGRRLYSSGNVILIDQAPWTKEGWFESAYPIHSGRYWGLAGRFASLVIALVGFALTITGLLLRR